MASARTLRELRQEADTFFDEVFANAGDENFARNAASLIGPRSLPPLPGWPEPDAAQMKFLTDRAVTGAFVAVERAAEALRLSNIATGFRSYPEARLEFTEGDATDFAPLLTFCLDSILYGGLARVVTHAHSRFTRSKKKSVDGGTVRIDLYPGDDGIALMERANQFLLTEIVLWDLARRDGGYEGTAPYPIRYESTRFLWSPRIAGAAFCLRCGEPIFYRRAGRSGSQGRSVPVCGPCIRSDSLRWPKHALMPHTRGKWWLKCRYPSCGNAFVGAGQARYCDEHTSSRLARKMRVRNF